MLMSYTSMELTLERPREHIQIPLILQALKHSLSSVCVRSSVQWYLTGGSV